MHFRPVLAVVVLVTFTSACATNPARRLTPNEELVTVHPEDDAPAVFTRGADPLDEQEFYEVIDDKESFEKVKGSRDGAAALQGLGVGMGVGGALIAVGALLTYLLATPSFLNETPTLTLPEETQVVPLYGGIGGAIVAGVGIAIASGSQARVIGTKRIFDLPHAQNRLEVGLYGADGATPDDVKSLSFGLNDPGDRLCAHDGLALSPLVARDARGRPMVITDRAKWFEWLSTPQPGLLNAVPDAPVVSSHLNLGLTGLDSDVALTIRVQSTGVGQSLNVPITFSCPVAVGADAASGKPGGHGRSGRSGSGRDAPGADGADGGDGGDGGEGPRIRAEAAWVNAGKRGRLALLVVGQEGRLFDEKAGAVVSAGGGSGGSGGSGGDGGSGAHGSDCNDGAAGGDGGRGGRGGRGGSGGRVELKVSEPSLLKLIDTSAPGGSAGFAGSGGGAGSGGTSGSQHKCGRTTKTGRRGTSGTRGVNGGEGRPGTTDEDVVSFDDLDQVEAYVRTHPELELERPSGISPVPMRKKRR